MHISKRICRDAFASVALLLAAFAGPGCTSFGSDNGKSADTFAPDASNSGDDTPKATAVNGTPDQSDVTEALGVFVSPTGRADNAGTKVSPLDTVQAGIELGKRTGKRVYVCSGTFREALVLADSISIIGGLDCSGERWTLSAARTRIEAPSSPALRAKDISSPTRLERLDIVAPNATGPSASSIGVLAEHAAGLTIAGSKITAGAASNGNDGTEGIQLVQGASARGGDQIPAAPCGTGADPAPCERVPVGIVTEYANSPGAAGGTSSCAGAPGHDGETGGKGGNSGLFYGQNDNTWHKVVNDTSNQQKYAPTAGQPRSNNPGAAGTSAGPRSALGALSGDGYVAANGVSGTDGAPGSGGFGGPGGPPTTPAVAAYWRGNGGPGGGAGGCPGLAGTAGTGGGASIGLALLESPVTVDSTEVFTGRGGTAGRGTFGSDATPGGAAGTNTVGDPAHAGGDGGAAGISSNGGNGPSVGILHSGAPPTVRGGTKFTPGQVGPFIDSRSHADVFGNTRTIPATPGGISKDILAL